MRAHLTLFALTAIAAPAGAQAQQERYAVMSSGQNVGHLHVTRSGTRVETEYRVDDNGRGPKIRERWQLGPDGLPRELALSGATTFGSPAKESFRLRGGRAEWQTLNDRGTAPAGGPAAYLPIEGSPYYAALYLPALLAAPHRTLPTWPAGSIRAERVRDITLGGRSETVWALWGLELSPALVLADSAGRWTGAISSSYVVVPEKLAGEAEALGRLAAGLESGLLESLTKRLAHRWDRPVQLRDVRVLDPVSGALSAPTTVVTYGGRITAVAPDLPPPDSGVVIEGEGGTLVPGLFDMHVHYGAWDGPLHLAAGVTTVRDMGNTDAVLDGVVRGIESGKMMGPRVVRAGFIEGRSQFSSEGSFIADSLPAALDAVRRYATHGYQMVKLYNSLPPDWVAPIAAEAHRLGLTVAGHVPAFSSSPRVVRDGYDEITHINQLVLSFLIDTDKEDTRTPFRFTALGLRTAKLSLDDPRFQALVAEMVKRGVAHDPTIATFQSLLLARPGATTVVDSAWLDHVPGPVQRSRKVALLDIKPGEDPVYRASSQRLRDVLKYLFDRGVRLVPGTDDLSGVMLHSELEEWQRAGIPPRDVLRLATVGAAEHLGLEHELGTIARGKRADLVLVPGDPTQDVGLLRQARLVMRDGVVYYPDELHEAIGVRPFGKRAAARAQAPSDGAERLGTVHFEVSCSDRAQREFDHAMALLHHMTYPQARAAFERTASLDPRCAMAHWGTAMTLFQPLWPTRPGPEDIRRGRDEIARARTLGVSSQRERLFLEAGAAFFREPDSTDYWDRVRGWREAMERVHSAYPEDDEASVWLALATLAVAPAAGVARAESDRAAGLLLEVYRRNPDHPGAMHYLIHADDVPGREHEQPDVVRRYEALAPRNPHALHMPTHIYTRLGEWERVVAGNLRAADAALEHPVGDERLVWDEFPHAVEYTVYAYLQLGRYDEALGQLRRLQRTERLEPTFKTAFHLASTAARYALERHDWSAAAALRPREPASLDWDRFAWAEAVTWFARGLGDARLGRVEKARAASARLRELETAAERSGEALFARQIRVLRLALGGWVLQAAGQHDSAVAWMRQAESLETNTPKPAVTPAPTLPADELLGDLFLEQKRPADALAAYRKSLELYPRRRNSVLGAARAAREAGDKVSRPVAPAPDTASAAPPASAGR